MDLTLSRLNRLVFLVLFATFFGLYVYVFHHRKNAEVAGTWKVIIVENIPPLVASSWHLGQELTIFPDGRGYSGRSYATDAATPITFFVERGWCWRPCFQLTHLNVDYRLSPSTSYAMAFQNPNWIDLSDRYGTRIVLNRLI